MKFSLDGSTVYFNTAPRFYQMVVAGRKNAEVRVLDGVEWASWQEHQPDVICLINNDGAAHLVRYIRYWTEVTDLLPLDPESDDHVLLICMGATGP